MCVKAWRGGPPIHIGVLQINLNSNGHYKLKVLVIVVYQISCNCDCLVIIFFSHHFSKCVSDIWNRSIPNITFHSDD